MSLVVVAGLTGAACSEQATPIDQVPVTDATATTQQVTPHLLAPTEQMKQVARQQCLDHPEKAQEVVNAVDPGRPGQVLASVTLDCVSVRAGGSGETDATTTSTTTAPATASSARS